ncbi:MAG: hypothetical protein PHY47_26405 [Lachnospiraceae bacterium]|nr:hypothetical protein [Lachnospiraceae bacterium]
MDENEKNNIKLRLFVDMDGTLSEFKAVDTLEKLYEENYFLKLKPQQNIVDSIRNIVLHKSEIEVYVLSAVLTDSKYAKNEKNEWLDIYLPEIDREHRIYLPCGEDKSEYIKSFYGGIRQTDYLLDDYSKNLHAWEPPAKGIKLMNGINGKNGTWQNERLSIEKNVSEFTECLLKIMNGNDSYRDNGPDFVEAEVHRRSGR